MGLTTSCRRLSWLYTKLKTCLRFSSNLNLFTLQLGADLLLLRVFVCSEGKSRSLGLLEATHIDSGGVLYPLHGSFTSLTTIGNSMDCWGAKGKSLIERPGLDRGNSVVKHQR